MDRHVSGRVTYWTGVWDPAREALSKEVEALRVARRPDARVVSVSRGQRSAWRVRDGVVQLSGHHACLIRVLASAFERRTDVNHVFGAASEWCFLRYLRRRPLLFTVALPGVPPDPALYDNVSLFTAESHALAASLIAAGAPPARVRVVYPGIDLTHYTASALPVGSPFRVLFASTPADTQELEARGIPLLVDAARALPDVEFVLLWRQWGDMRAAERALQALAPPMNLKIERGPVSDMAIEYRRVHATVCCFAEGFGKSCPNSIVEGLGCGRPALVSETVGIANLIHDHSAGVIFPRTVEGLVGGVERLRGRLEQMSRSARVLAEQTFGLRQFLNAYEELYDLLPARHGVAAPAAGYSSLGKQSMLG